MEDRYQPWAGPPPPGKVAATPDREECMAGSLAASAKSSTTAATIGFHLRAATKLAH
jgi:hypothetical protein